MLWILRAIGAAGLLCQISGFKCEPNRTVDDLFHGKSITTVVHLQQRGDGMGAVMQSIIYLAAYVRFRGWSFGEINRHVADRPHPHGVQKGLFFDFLFPNISQMGPAVHSEMKMDKVHLPNSSMLNLVETQPNTFYEVNSDVFDLDRIARENHSTLDQYLNSDFRELARSVSTCSVRKELDANSVYKGKKWEALRVVAHVRRGDIISHADRYIPDNYFIGVLKAIRDIYPLAELHVFSHNDKLTNDNSAVWNQYLENGIGVHIANENHQSNTADTITAIAHFMTADVFMMSKSSFSSVPAYYNPNCVLYTPFWHDPLSHWISLPSNFSVDSAADILKSQLPACVAGLRHSIFSGDMP